MKNALSEVKRLQKIAGLLKENEASRKGVPVKIKSDEDGNLEWKSPGAGYVLIHRRSGMKPIKGEYYPEGTDENFLKSRFNELVSKDSEEDLVVILQDSDSGYVSSMDPEETYLTYDSMNFGDELIGKWEDGRAEELSTPPNYGM